MLQWIIGGVAGWGMTEIIGRFFVCREKWSGTIALTNDHRA